MFKPRPQGEIPRTATGIGALGLATALAAAGIIPTLLAGAYFGISALACLMYWLDKSAAQNDGKRTPENTLHLLGRIGGWPGALIAQQQFRHKTIKQPFQAVFWSTVAINVVAATWLVRSGVATEFSRSLSG